MSQVWSWKCICDTAWTSCEVHKTAGLGERSRNADMKNQKRFHQQEEKSEDTRATRLKTYDELLAEDMEKGTGIKGVKRKCDDNQQLDLPKGKRNNQRLRPSMFGPKVRKRMLQMAGV